MFFPTHFCLTKYQNTNNAPHIQNVCFHVWLCLSRSIFGLPRLLQPYKSILSVTGNETWGFLFGSRCTKLTQKYYKNESWLLHAVSQWKPVIINQKSRGIGTADTQTMMIKHHFSTTLANIATSNQVYVCSLSSSICTDLLNWSGN